MLTLYRAQFRSNLAEHISKLNPIANQQLNATQMGMGAKFGAAVGFSNFSTAGLKEMAFRLERQAFVLGFNRMMWVMFFCSSLALIPVYFLRTKSPLKGPVDAH